MVSLDATVHLDHVNNNNNNNNKKHQRNAEVMCISELHKVKARWQKLKSYIASQLQSLSSVFVFQSFLF
jgi:hypothetical protein